MTTYKIVGGNPLSGTVTPAPNKNSILPLICAATLTSEPVTFTNVPKSASVRTLLRIFRKLGGKVAYLEDNKVRLNGATINSTNIPADLAKKERSSIMFLGPLLSRFGKAAIEDAGGCTLGNRPVDTLITGLKELGAVTQKDDIYNLTTKGLKGTDVWQLEASVTGTENLVLAAVLADGETEIYNAACEPHVQDVCNFLNSIGAKITGIGTNLIKVRGVEKLTGGEWEIIPDYIDIGGLIVAAAITGGEITINTAIPEHMGHILMFYQKLNLKYDIIGDKIHIPANQNLKALTNLKGDIDKIPAQPWPTGFPADLIPQALVLAIMAKGSINIMNNMYETQLQFVNELIQMKAKVTLSNPTQAITFGPSKLKGTTLAAPAIIQCAHAMALAAFAAEGETIITNADSIKRRYPHFVESMRALGGDITEI
jgi:UDP-N-acetylglucosamine 1-carboxyvinyltransferase